MNATQHNNRAEIATLNTRRDDIARELDKAAGAALSLGALKRSAWYQDRAALIRDIDNRLALLAK